MLPILLSLSRDIYLTSDDLDYSHCQGQTGRQGAERKNNIFAKSDQLCTFKMDFVGGAPLRSPRDGSCSQGSIPIRPFHPESST